MQTDTDERRSTARDRTMLGGLVAIDSKSSKVSCVVRNLSAAGAAVDFPVTATMPDRLNLSIVKSGRNHPAKIVWFRANRAGLSFDTPQAAGGADASPDLEERLRVAEKKARNLKRRVRELSGEG